MSQPLDAYAVGQQLVALCKENKFREAVEQLYDANIVSVEVCGSPEMPAKMTGIDAIRGKTEWWEANHTVHRTNVLGPFPHGDRFIAIFDMDVTPKVGPRANQRVSFQEAALYTVSNGKVVHEEFFYHMDM